MRTSWEKPNQPRRDAPAGGLDALANQLGVPREQARRGAEALLPSILGGMGQRAQTGDGNELEAQVHKLGGPELAHNVVGPEPTDAGRGNQMLGSIFGSKETSRQVAGQASQTSGLDPALLKKMLPIPAMLLAGHLSQRSAGQQGGMGGILGSVLGAMAGGGAGGSQGGGLGGVLGSVLGGSANSALR
jgi:hypothetical protein